jgi:hypothetical protein
MRVPKKKSGPLAICSNAKRVYMGVRYVKGRCIVHRDAVRGGTSSHSTIEDEFGH